MPAVVTTNNDYTSPQHDTMTESAPWNTTTADNNNFESTATFNDQGPPSNVQNAGVGTDTLDTATYPETRYDPSQPQQPDVVQSGPPPIDTQVPPMMANDVHNLPPPQDNGSQQQQPPAQPSSTYEAQTNGGGGHANYQDLSPTNNNQEMPAPMPAPSGNGAATEDTAPNDHHPLSPAQPVISDDFGQQQPVTQPPPTTQQVDTEQLNGTSNDMVPPSSMSDKATPSEPAMMSEELPMQQTPVQQQQQQPTPSKAPPKVQFADQASPQQAVLTGSEKTEESPNYPSAQTTSTIPHPVNTQQQHQPAPPTKQNSWAAKMMGNAGKSSPPRYNQLKITTNSRGRENVLGGKGTIRKTTSMEGIRVSIHAAIQQKRTIWVSYNGHQKPFIPRCIEPKKWDNRGRNDPKEAAFWARQHKSKSGNQQRFFLRNVLEVRGNVWRIPDGELRKLRKQYPSGDNNNNSGRGGGGYGGGGYGGNQGQNTMNDRGQRYGGGGGGGSNKRSERRGQRYGGGGGGGGNQTNVNATTSGNMQ